MVALGNYFKKSFYIVGSNIANPTFFKMENNFEPLDAQIQYPSEHKIELTEELAAVWLNIAGWALFFLILLFFGAGIFLLVAVLSTQINWGYAVAMLIFGGVLFLPGYFLARFRSKLKLALYEESAKDLEISFRGLRHLYVVLGVLTILFGLLVLIGIGAGIYGAMMSKVPF